MENLANKILNKSLLIESKQQAIINEIVDYFDKILSSKEYAQWLEDLLSGENNAKKRKYSFDVEYWGYSSGCSDTCFRAGGKTWTNPEHPYGHDSYYYKGIHLSDIQNKVGEALLDLTMKYMREYGFWTSYTDKETWLRYYHKQVTITW